MVVKSDCLFPSCSLISNIDHHLSILFPCYSGCKEKNNGCGHFWEFFATHPWVPALTERQVDMLIVNAGPHMHSVEFAKDVVDWAAAYLEAHYTGRLIWRNSIPGHPNCGETIESGPQQNESYVWDYSGRHEAFSWHLFDQYNDYADKVFSKLGALILYADKLLRLRHDGHAVGDDLNNPDCLHYKLPSPIDYVTIALYNELEAEYFQKENAKGRGEPWTPEVVVK